MNGIHANIATLNNSTNIACNTNNDAIQENSSMITLNAFNATRRFIALTARIACALVTFVCLLAMTNQAALANVVVDRFVGPQETYGVPVGQTGLQLKVRNTTGFSLSGVNVQTYIYLPIDVLGGWTVRAMPNSGNFTLAPYESKWVTVIIPQNSLQGFSLRNQRLIAKAVVGQNQYWLHNFLNVPAAAKVQINITNVTPLSNGAKRFTIQFVNNGYAPSTAQTVQVSTWKYAGGQVGSALTQSGNIGALQVGQSTSLTFTSQPTEGYEIRGSVRLADGTTISFSI